MSKHLLARCTFVAVSLLLATIGAKAQSKVVKVIVPFSAGGVTDAAARTVLQRMAVVLGQPVIVENRPGAGTRIGIEAVMQAAADGKTLLFTNTTYSILPVVDPSVRYEPTKALAPVALVGTYGMPVVVSNKLPVNTLQAFIAYAQQHPGQLSYGSSGMGSGTHFAGEYFKLLTKTDMLHVPYKSTSAAAADVAAQLLDLTFDAAAKPYADAGKLKILAVTSVQRDPRMLAVPTVAEAGLPAFTQTSWVGLLAPAGTPHATVARLNQAVATALTDPAIRQAMRDLGVSTAGGPPQDMAQAIADGTALYRRMVREIPNLTE